MINVNEIVAINGIYISQLYKNWYAVEVMVMRGENLFRIRYPYKSIDDASLALGQIKQKQQNIKAPDYRPAVHIMNQGKLR